jgi:hypothetical protein
VDGGLDGGDDGVLATISVTVEPTGTVDPALGFVSITRPGATVGSLRRCTSTLSPSRLSRTLASASVSSRSAGIDTSAGAAGVGETLGDGGGLGDGAAELGAAELGTAELATGDGLSTAVTPVLLVAR